MKSNPFPDDNVYFVSSGVSAQHLIETMWDDVVIPKRESKSWICHYCGSENDPNTWSCSHCPAPRREVTKAEQAVWQPPTRVALHEESKPVDWKSVIVLPIKPLPPWWTVVLAIVLWLGVPIFGAGAVISLLFTSFPSMVVSVFISWLCYCAFGRLRGLLRDRYDWGVS